MTLHERFEIIDEETRSLRQEVIKLHQELDDKYLKEIVELKYELEALWVHIKNLESKPNPGYPPVEKTILATGHWGYGGTTSLKANSMSRTIEEADDEILELEQRIDDLEDELRET